MNKIDLVICKFNIILFLKAIMLLSPIILLFFNENGLNLSDLFFCQGIFYICAILFDIPIGYLSNTKSRKYLLFSAQLVFLLITILWLCFKGYYIILFGEILYAYTKTAIDNVPSGYLFDYLSTKNKSMPQYWGYSYFYMALGVAISSLLGAYLYYISGSRLILIIEAILISISIILILSLPDIKSQNTISKSFKQEIKEYIEIIKDICKNKSIITYVFYSGLLNSYSFLFALLFQPIMKNAIFPIIMFGVITFSNNIIRSIAGVVAGKWFKNTNIRNLIVPTFISFLFAFLCIFICISNKNINLITLLIFIVCIIIGFQIIFLVLHFSRIHKFVPLENRGSLMTVNNIVARTFPAIILVCSRLYMDKLGLPYFVLIAFIIFAVIGGYIMIKTLEIKD
jgi:MFS family permease